MKAHDQKDAFMPKLKKPVQTPERYVLSAALMVLDAMPNAPWAQIEHALNGVYEGLRGSCFQWVKEEDKELH